MAITALTAANQGNFVPVLYAKLALANERAETFTRAFFSDWSDMRTAEGRGGSIVIPQAGTLTVGDMGTTVAGQDPTASSKTITLNKWREVTFMIRKDMSAKAGELLARTYIDDAVALLREDFDDYVLGLHAGFNVHTPQAAAALTGANLLTKLLDARKDLNAAKVLQGDRAWVFHPELESRLYTIDQFIRIDYKDEKPIEAGRFVGRLLGAPVFMSPMVDSVTVSAVTTYSNLYVHKSAIGHVVAFDDFEINYVPQEKGLLHSADILYGATVLYPGRGTIITCTA